MAVGTKLGQIIKEKGLTQKEVAEKAGITPQTINAIIRRDSARADIQIMLKICKALDINIDIFADDALEEFYQDHPNAPRIEENTNFNLNKNQKRIVALFNKLTETQQENLIGRAELLAEQNAEAGVKDTKPAIDIASAGKPSKTYTGHAVAYGGASKHVEITQEKYNDISNLPRKLAKKD